MLGLILASLSFSCFIGLFPGAVCETRLLPASVKQRSNQFFRLLHWRA